MTWHQYLPQWIPTAAKAQYEQGRIRQRIAAAERQLVSEAQRVSDACLENMAGLEAWQQEREDLKQKLAYMLGLHPQRERTPLRAELAGCQQLPAYTIEKLIFQSQPGLYVTANFYLPRTRDGKVPCVIYLNGHWPSPYGAKTGYQDRYLWYPAHGFACLTVDPLGFGEIPGIHHGTSSLGFWNWLSLGYTPAGIEVWNAMRALDWLETRAEVDAARVGLTGISGGGVISQYFAALDERIAATAASCSTYTIGTQAALNLVQEQCDCTYYPNVHRLDFPSVLALVAPRPLLVLGGRKDPIFPPAGFRRAYRRAGRIYDLYRQAPGDETRIRLVESSTAHADPPQFLQECRSFMRKWLRPSTVESQAPAEDPSPTPQSPGDLACLRALPPGATNFHIHDTWFNQPNDARRRAECPKASVRIDLQSFLLSEVFSWFPAEQAPFNTRRLRNSGGSAGRFANFGDYEFETEPGVRIRATRLNPRSSPPRAPVLIYIKGPSEQSSTVDLDEFLPLLSHTAVIILTPRFADMLIQPDDFARIERTAALTGRTVAALRVWDVIRTVAWVGSEADGEIGPFCVYGRGENGVIGLYAALLEHRIGHVILRRPPSSHRDGPAILTVLRHTDIPDVAAALAPRPVTVLRSFVDHVLDSTGAPAADAWPDEHVLVAGSLAEALLSRVHAR